MNDTIHRRLAPRFYESCLRIRRVEEEIARLYPTDRIKSPVHLSIGQESVAVGACEALTPRDVVFATYRGHAAYIARGGNLRAMWAELYGKRSGCARGKAGSMHLIDTAVNMMGTSAIVATSIPNSVGYAWALGRQGRDALVLSFFGEGATDEGAFHESMNFAALKRLPIVFVCENNGFAIYSPVETRMARPNLCERAAVYGMPARHVAGGDIFEVHRLVGEAARGIRESGTGPVFIEVETRRWRDHVGPGEDFHLGYRGAGDLASWREADQLARLAGLLDAPTRAAIEARVEAEVADAIAFAEADTFPGPEELHDHVFAG